MGPKAEKEGHACESVADFPKLGLRKSLVVISMVTRVDLMEFVQLVFCSVYYILFFLVLIWCKQCVIVYRVYYVQSSVYILAV